MPKVNVYLPDDLAAAVRDAGIPVSTVCQRALDNALRQTTALREGTRSQGAGLPGGIRLPLRSTARLVQAIELAFDEARRHDHGFVGTEHLLLGMLGEDGNLGLRVVMAMDVLPGDLRVELEGAMSQALVGAPSGEPHPTPRARRALDLMAEEALQLHHNYLGCEHLLLGLIREPEGLAGQVLRTMGFDLTVTRRAVLTALVGFAHARQDHPSPPTGVEELLAEIVARLDRIEARVDPN